MIGSTPRRFVVGTAAVLLTALALLALHAAAREVTFAEVRTAFHVIAPSRLWLSAALTATSYLALTGYDFYAFKALGKPVPWRSAAFGAFTGFTLSHNLGLSLLTGGAARYRAYGGDGVRPATIGAVLALTSAAFWSGVAILAGLAIASSGTVGPIALTGGQGTAAGAMLVAAGLLPLIVRSLGVEKVRLGPWHVALPPAAIWVRLLLVSVADLAAASTALFVLIPQLPSSDYPREFGAYAAALLLAGLSHVPGGLGVFEAIMVAAVPNDRAGVIAALAAYRAIYYLLPLFIAAGLLIVRGRKPLGRQVADDVATLGRVGIETLAPIALGGLTFIGGLILLLSGATPAQPGRASAIAAVIPMPFIEASHIAASLAGTALLFLAQGLWRRLDGAFVLARALFVGAAMFSILKGLDYEEATVCLAIAGLLQASRHSFYRRSALTSEPLSLRWTIAALAAFAGSIVVGLFAYKHVDYDVSLWWRFVEHDGAPRFLRASLAGGVLVAGFGLWRMVGPTRAAAVGEPLDEARIAAVLGHAEHTNAFLAYTGDKRFIHAPQGDAFVMFGVRGDSWIVLGDPVGNPARWERLFWRLREECDAAQGRLLIYQLTERSLPHVIDLGFRVSKYGEEAIVPLADFSLAGKGAKSLRHSARRAVAEGAAFAILSPEEAQTAMAELADVSAEWLAGKRREKRFSLGAFSPEYVARFPCAVVRQGGRIVAFANIFALPNKDELSVDLMRHRQAMPYGTMDFLFVELMRWGAAEGYRRFNLGMTPLAGLPRHRLAPLLGRTGGFLFRRGTRLYGFSGLRDFKAKFQPTWQSRYLAAPSEIGMLRSLVSLHGLISHA